jgi:hypothetical protein
MICDASVGVQIAEKMQEIPSAHRHDSCGREMCRRGNDELGTIFTEPVPDRLRGSTGQRNGIPLFLVITSDHVSSVERTRGCTVSGYERQVVLGLPSIKTCGTRCTRDDNSTTILNSICIRK